MKMRALLQSCAALALLAAPAALAAQNADEQVDVAATGAPAEDDEMQKAMAMLGGMFPADPLTAEQEARLPQAQRIVAQMIPAGSLGEMMGGMFDKMIGPMLDVTGGPAGNVVTRATGLTAEALDMSPEQMAELAALFDPAYVERHEREMALMPGFMRDMMTLMEPTMRKAMSELYAIHFSQTELNDIEAFFQTDSGTAFARKSFTMSSDPRIISATMESLPQLMGAFAGLEEKVAAAGADLPAKRDFNALSKAEQARVAALTGYTVVQIKERLAEREAE